MSLTRWRLVSESLELSPCLFFYVELVDVPEGVLLPNRGSTEHNQTVMHLNWKLGHGPVIRQSWVNLRIYTCASPLPWGCPSWFSPIWIEMLVQTCPSRVSQSKVFVNFLSFKRVLQKCTFCCRPCRLSEHNASKGRPDPTAGCFDANFMSLRSNSKDLAIFRVYFFQLWNPRLEMAAMSSERSIWSVRILLLDRFPDSSNGMSQSSHWPRFVQYLA